MFYLLHCGGMPFNGTTVEKQSLGGSESAAYYVAKELAVRGHKVTIFTNSKEEGEWDNIKYCFSGVQSESAPLGERFHYYAECTPHDVCIVQRTPYAFTRNIKSKINLLWMHDLASKENEGLFSSQMWNVDGVLTVSQYHKEQIIKEYSFDKDILMPITNGVDLAGDAKVDKINLCVKDREKFKMFYSSRPERGLENLVKKGGIVDKLNEKGKYVLFVCHYNNVAFEMKDYYEYLWQCCENNPNIELLGSLSKKDLYSYMKAMDLMVYPTSFREVSCITAMECMACGLPFISSEVGALPETCKDSGSVLVPLNNSKADIKRFINSIVSIKLSNREKVVIKQLKASKKYTWVEAVEKLEVYVTAIKIKKRFKYDVAKELYSNSDIMVLRKYLNMESGNIGGSYGLDYFRNELSEHYSFIDDDNFYKHYSKFHKEIIHVEEDLYSNPRYQVTANHIHRLCNIDNASNSNNDCKINVLDYGCAHGHYTINLAKDFKEGSFFGYDFMESSIEFAEKWARKSNIKNVKFTNKLEKVNTVVYDCIMIQEVLEHVKKPWVLINELIKSLKIGGTLLISVPFGPWEKQEYKGKFKNYREHIWHIERSDIHTMLKEFGNLKVSALYYGDTEDGIALGNYVVTAIKLESSKALPIDINEKLKSIIPARQSVSVCMLVSSSNETLTKCLNKLKVLADEFIFYIDKKNCNEQTISILEDFRNSITTPAYFIYGESPLEIGFDKARNISIRKAVCSWIMWVDTDEFLVHPEKLLNFLRNNQFNGYALEQHHCSYDPVETIAVDLPVRVFRNKTNIKFCGVVHEHPEKIINKGVGTVQKIKHSWLVHEAYETELVRRKRFERNFPLMKKDRLENPERLLGKFLWIRDIAHIVNYSLEDYGEVSKELIKESKACMPLFMDVMKSNMRHAVDCLKFYNTLVTAIGKGIEIKFKINGHDIHGIFFNEEHLDVFLKGIFKDSRKEVLTCVDNYRFN